MDLIWEHGELSASQLRDLLSERRELARETVRTMVTRMEEKGWLKHRVIGQTNLYSAAEPRTATLGRRLLELLDTLCGGSPEQLMSALLDCRGLTRQEADRIQDLINDAKQTKPASRRGKT